MNWISWLFVGMGFGALAITVIEIAIWDASRPRALVKRGHLETFERR